MSKPPIVEGLTRGFDDARAVVSGAGAYLADLPMDDVVEVAFVRSSLPNARIRRIRAGDSQCITAAHLHETVDPLIPAMPGVVPVPWMPLADGRVRYVGEPLAAVWAANRYEAEDSANAVEVDYDELPDAVPVHELAPDNFLYRSNAEFGDVLGGQKRADMIVSGEFVTARQTPTPLGGRGVLARYDPQDDVLVVWTTTQLPEPVRDYLAAALRVPREKVRVLVPRVGGAFGLTAQISAEEIVVAAIAMKLRRPVRWTEDRLENLIASSHAHDERVRLEAAFGSDGRLLAVDATITVDVGAWSTLPFAASMEPITTASTLFGAYQMPAYRYRTSAFASYKCPAGGYRGVGMNAAVFATERAMDIAAERLGLDPLEMRRRNAYTSFPTTTINGRYLDSGDYTRLLQELKTHAQYDTLVAWRDTQRKRGRNIGIGVALFNEHTGTGIKDYRKRGVDSIRAVDSARVRVLTGGRIEILTSAADAGQGHAETYVRLAERELGARREDIVVIEGDTAVCPEGIGSQVSRGGVGVVESVIQALRLAAANDLAPGTDVSYTYEAAQTFSSGAHLAVVEVDLHTYVPRLLKYVAVEDCGEIVDLSVVDGQIRGGVAMGVGNVLLEEQLYGANGQNLTGSLLDYLLPVAAEIPEIEIHHISSPSPLNTNGSKGVGECGTIGAFGAIPNAVADALRTSSVTQLPLSPERLFRLIHPHEALPGR